MARVVTQNFLTTLVAGLLLLPAVARAENLTFEDPKGDDDGWGKMVYPTGKDYKRGSFDITKVEITEEGEDVVFEIHLAADVEDPWSSKDWGGNGFSVQFAQIYLDTDGKKRSGERKGVPGSYVEFTPDSYYEKVVLVSPQPASKLQGELGSKARFLARRAVIPTRTEARKRSIVARVPKSVVGTPSKSWGVQVVMLSNEGFAAPEDVLSRKVNEYEGEHRFGGGCDGFGDPHVVDMLGPKQHAQLAAHTCADVVAKAKVAKISMVRL